VTRHGLRAAYTGREAAVAALTAIEPGRTTLGAEIERLRPRVADERDRGLLVEIVSGALRWQGELDALLSQCSRRPLADLEPVVRATLRAAAYQIEHLDRVPGRAAVHESVEIVRRLGEPRAAGFVNAVLRSLTRDRGRLHLPPRPPADAPDAARLAYLSVTLSHPAWLAARWMARVGFEAAEAWCRFNNQPPPLTVRSLGRLAPPDLLARVRAAGIDAVPAPFVTEAIQLPPGAFSRLPAPLRAEILAQDEGSQIVAHALGVHPGDVVLDLCASPGGKTLVLSADLAARGTLVAADQRERRVRLLRRTLTRAGSQALLVRLDATAPLPFGPVFDRVLLDAPCSGLGTVRRDPDVKWHRRPAQLADFAQTQRALLARAATVVRPGGAILYATCSSEPEENEAVVEAFLAGHPQFGQAPVHPGSRVNSGDSLVDERGALRLLPFRHGLDAFFGAFLVRHEAA
jgi:16S rRNA (cytosine967-C5)-methyltransferase